MTLVLQHTYNVHTPHTGRPFSGSGEGENILLENKNEKKNKSQRGGDSYAVALTQCP